MAMKFIGKFQRGRLSTDPYILTVRNQVQIILPRPLLDRTGWEKGARIAVGYDADAKTIGLLAGENGYALVSQGPHARQLRIGIGKRVAATVGIPTDQKIQLTVETIRDDGLVILAEAA